MKISAWVMQDHCSLRYVLGTDKEAIGNRVAFIEKTPRVRVAEFNGNWAEDQNNWLQGPKGCAPEYGQYQPSRDWCDAQLIEMGYILTEEED